MPPRRQRSSGSRSSARQVDVGVLEERDVVVARVDVAQGGGEQALDERRAQHGLLARERLLQFDGARCRVLGQKAPGVRLRVPEADEHVLDPASDALVLGEPAEHRLTRRQACRDVVEPEARDLLDDVDLASHVAGAPGRDRDCLAVDAEAEPLQDRVLLLRRSLDPDARRRFARAGSEPPAAPAAPAWTSACPSHSRRRARRAAASRASPPARRARDRRPSPSGSSPRCAGADAPTCGRSCTARSSRPRAGSSVVSVADLGLLAAHDPGERDRALGVGDHQVVRLELTFDAVERAQLLARPARGARRSCRPRASSSRTRAAGCRARA